MVFLKLEVMRQKNLSRNRLRFRNLQATDCLKKDLGFVIKKKVRKDHSVTINEFQGDEVI